MRTCSRCHKTFDDSHFAWRHRRSGIRQSYCRACQKILSDSHYVRHAKRLRRLARIRNNRTREEYRERIFSYLLQHPCECGQRNLATLDFHHVHDDKINTVSRMMSLKEPWSKILAEIEKCRVMCANCHRIETANKFGWYKVSPSPNGYGT